MVPALDPSPGPVRVALAGPMLTAHAACTCAKAPPRGAPPRAGAVNAQPAALAAMAPRTAPVPAQRIAMTAAPARPAPERAPLPNVANPRARGPRLSKIHHLSATAHRVSFPAALQTRGEWSVPAARQWSVLTGARTDPSELSDTHPGARASTSEASSSTPTASECFATTSTPSALRATAATQLQSSPYRRSAGGAVAPSQQRARPRSQALLR